MANSGCDIAVRSDMPSDEKADTQDAELVDRVWTGVVPLRLTAGEPLPAPGNRVSEVPAYLRDHIGEAYAGFAVNP